jgi:hypothetical protein
MDSIHLVHPRLYDFMGGQFIRDAFANNQDSLSIIDLECSNQLEGGPCKYVRKYYRHMGRIASDPPVFYRFETDDLPEGRRGKVVRPDPDPVTNPCHWVVENLDDDELWEKFQDVKLIDLWICDNGQVRRLGVQEAFQIKTAHEAKEAERAARRQRR